MSFRCISVNSQIEQHEFSNTIYPQSILIEDINQDNVIDFSRISKDQIKSK